MVESLDQGTLHAWPRYLRRAWHKCRPLWRGTRHTSTENSGIIVPVSRIVCTADVIIFVYPGSRVVAHPLFFLCVTGDLVAFVTAAHCVTTAGAAPVMVHRHPGGGEAGDTPGGSEEW